MTVRKFRIIDPKRPKKPLSAFFFYSVERRPMIQKKNPDFSFGRTAKLLGQEWRKISSSSKAKYERKHRLGLRNYVLRMKRYKRPSQEKLFDLYGILPKGRTTSFGYYVKFNYSKTQRMHPEKVGFIVTIRSLAGSWRGLPDGKRAFYQIHADRDAERFRRQMHMYLSGSFQPARNEKFRKLSHKSRGPIKCVLIKTLWM